MEPPKLRVAVYGTNGHQVIGQVASHPDAELVAVAGVAPEALPDGGKGVRLHATLEDLLRDSRVDLVSLCSPRRADQARDAVCCLNAGKHVYAEKPCAMTERELDAVLRAVEHTGLRFREMAGTVCDTPYRQMREVVQSGRIGTVVQVHAQKSYPWHDARPEDEAVDGGLLMQVGIYAARSVEHIACRRIASMHAVETTLGNPRPAGACRMAAAFLMELDNGGIASAICNYLNPIQPQCWGYEILRIFGTAGAVESNADGNVARLLLTGQDPQQLDASGPSPSHLDLYLASLRGRGEMPLSLEDEVNPTRWVIRARDAARQAAAVRTQ